MNTGIFGEYFGMTKDIDSHVLSHETPNYLDGDIFGLDLLAKYKKKEVVGNIFDNPELLEE